MYTTVIKYKESIMQGEKMSYGFINNFTYLGNDYIYIYIYLYYTFHLEPRCPKKISHIQAPSRLGSIHQQRFY